MWKVLQLGSYGDVMSPTTRLYSGIWQRYIAVARGQLRLGCVRYTDSRERCGARLVLGLCKCQVCE